MFLPIRRLKLWPSMDQDSSSNISAVVAYCDGQYDRSTVRLAIDVWLGSTTIVPGWEIASA